MTCCLRLTHFSTQFVWQQGVNRRLVEMNFVDRGLVDMWKSPLWTAHHFSTNSLDISLCFKTLPVAFLLRLCIHFYYFSRCHSLLDSPETFRFQNVRQKF